MIADRLGQEASGDRMTPKQAAAQLGVSYDFILDEIRAGRLRAVRLRAYRIDPADLEAWLNARADAQTEARRKAAALTVRKTRGPARRQLPKLPPIPTGHSKR